MRTRQDDLHVMVEVEKVCIINASLEICKSVKRRHAEISR